MIFTVVQTNNTHLNIEFNRHFVQVETFRHILRMHKKCFHAAILNSNARRPVVFFVELSFIPFSDIFRSSDIYIISTTRKLTIKMLKYLKRLIISCQHSVTLRHKDVIE